MLEITQDELLAFNVLNNTVVNAEAELRRSTQARMAFMGLLETKYNAVYNASTGTLEPKDEEEKAIKES